MKREAEITPGMYRHFKGTFYRVTDVGEHTETGERFVVYHETNLLGRGRGKSWVRPLVMFAERVQAGGKEAPRFHRVSD